MNKKDMELHLITLGSINTSRTFNTKNLPKARYKVEQSLDDIFKRCSKCNKYIVTVENVDFIDNCKC